MSEVSELVQRCCERLLEIGKPVSLARICNMARAREGRALAHTSILRDLDAAKIYREHRKWVAPIKRRHRHAPACDKYHKLTKAALITLLSEKDAIIAFLNNENTALRLLERKGELIVPKPSSVDKQVEIQKHHQLLTALQQHLVEFRPADPRRRARLLGGSDGTANANP